MTIRNIQEAEAALLPYVPLVKQLTGKHTTLDRMWPLMELIGNPQDKIKVIHIAGTSGKTSTAYYIAALLRAGGSQVGLSVSPHVDSITERIQLNGRPLTEAVFCEELGIFLDIVKRLDQPPSYFELLCGFSLWVFERHQVDYAVIETGMGGLHDATNVITQPDKVCVITDIGLDHMNVLGNSLAKIAAQKIGIVHEHNTVFMYQQKNEVMRVVEQRVTAYKADLHVTTEHQEKLDYDDISQPMPDYQRHNWLLAYRTYLYLETRDNLQHLTSQVLYKTQQLQVPARMDIKQIGDKTVVMDGAHNAQKMTAFMDSFRHLYPGVKPVILMGLREGKEYETLVPLLAPLASRIIVTTFKTSQDLPIQSMDPERLAKAFRENTTIPVTSITDQHKAFEELLASPETTLVITGSFYLLGQIRNNEHLV